MTKRIELWLRLAFAWSRASRMHIRRSVGARYAKRSPRKRQQELSV